MQARVLNNRYQLEQRIGVGGMAYVYEAVDLVLKRKVAVKILKDQYLDDQEFVAKFEKEAQAAASLNHPNIVNVYDVGRTTIGDRVLHYIVMELIVGTTLKEAIAAHGRMTSPAIARTGKQIARALQTAHDHDLIHRDIKPANILITRTGDIKVADFGIARIASASTVTYTNNILGTVHYISPEQAKGQLIDEKSDIYSLGVVLYEMATGQVPFDADSSVGIAMKHIQEEVRPPIELNPNLDPGLNEIILRCLEKIPADRFASAQDLADALDNYRNLDDTLYMTRPRIERRSRPKKREAREVVYESRDDQAEEEEPRKGNRTKVIALMSVLAILVLVLAGIFWIQRKQDGENLAVVPAVINLKEEEAIRLLEKNGLVAEVTERRPDDQLEEGTVLDQSIVSSTKVAKGTLVNLTVSSGQSLVAVPDVTGHTVDEASKMLESAGFKLGQTIFDYKEGTVKGEIYQTDPAVSSQVAFGSRINLYVSRGEEVTKVVVPVLLNQGQNKAISLLNEAGLKVGQIESAFSDYPAGNVIKQSIEPGTEVDRNQTVDLVISKGKEVKPEESKTQTSVEYRIRLYPPEGKESFEVTIVDKNSEDTSPIFRKTYKAEEAAEKGYIVAVVEASEGADLAIYYDGVETVAKPPSKEE